MTEKLSVDRALAIIAAEVAPLPPGIARVGALALGHVTAAPVLVRADTPRFDCSAMDGFALRSGEASGAAPDEPAIFDLVDDIPAEAVPDGLPAGGAAPINTGSAMPAGADAVVARERCKVSGARLEVSAPVASGLNIRRRGEDMRAGSLILGAGTRISPEAIGALLAAGVTEILCRRPPRLTIIPTGSELAPAMAQPSDRLDSNGPMLEAACRTLGIACDLLPPQTDDPDILGNHFDRVISGSPADMVLSIGGVSGGRHDHVRHILERAGADIRFHGLSMRPGKPMLFARLRDGRPFFGLPGNPVAALVGFRFFVLAAIRSQMLLPPETGQPVPPPIEAREGTTLFMRGKQGRGEHAAALSHSSQRSHILSSVLEADCWIRVDRRGEADTALVYPVASHLS